MTVQAILAIHAIIIVSITICRMMFAHSENLSFILVLIEGLSGKLHCSHRSLIGKRNMELLKKNRK